MKTINILALSALLILPSLSFAEEIVLPPSQAEIDAFNACLRKGPMPCVLPTRTVIVPDEDPAPDMTLIGAPPEFYQAPPDELVRGRANAEMRERILNARGYRTYEWGIIRTQDGPPEPFVSYSQDSSSRGGDSVGRDRGNAGRGNSSGSPSGGGSPGGGSRSNSGDSNSSSGGGSNPGSGGAGQGRGQDCRR